MGYVLKVGGIERLAVRGERKKSSLIAKIFYNRKDEVAFNFKQESTFCQEIGFDM